MWQLKKTFRFEASHRLPHHDGKCANLHGHSWTLTVCVSGGHLVESGPKSDMLVDYGDVSLIVKPLVGKLDHSHLNDLLSNPTSERLAEYCYSVIASGLPSGIQLAWVEIGETCTTLCRFFGRQ